MAELTAPASLRVMIDEVKALHDRVADRIEAETGKRVRVYRLVPEGQPDTPCIYMVISDSPFEQRDLVRWRDNVNLLPRILVNRGTREAELGDLERFVDIYRQVVDGELAAPPPHLNGSAELAERRGLRLVEPAFDTTSYLGMELPLYVRLERFPEMTT